MTNALTVYDQFDELQRAAIALKESGYFKDVQSKAQAIVKVMAGAELGLPPFASMTGIHIIQGKPVLGANVLATLVKNDPRYDFQIEQATDTECALNWFESGSVGRNDRPVGQSSFTIEEAKKAGLTGKDNWKKYPSDMLFARAISRGARRFAPGIFGGSPVYTPDEMGADVDEEGNVIVDSTAADVKQVETPIEEWAKGPPEPEQTEPKPDDKPTSNGSRPYSPEMVRDKITEVAAFPKYDGYEASDAQRQLLRYGLELCFAGDKESGDKRHTVLNFIAGTTSTKEVSGAVLKAMLDKWLEIEKDDDTGDYSVSDMAVTEAQTIFTEALAGEGQKALI